MQPGDKVHIVSHAAGDLLRGMDVGIDEARQHILAMQVDDLRVRGDQGGIDRAHGQKAVAVDQNAAAVIDGLVLAHGDDIAVFQISLHGVLLFYVSRWRLTPGVRIDSFTCQPVDAVIK